MTEFSQRFGGPLRHPTLHLTHHSASRIRPTAHLLCRLDHERREEHGRRRQEVQQLRRVHNRHVRRLVPHHQRAVPRHKCDERDADEAVLCALAYDVRESFGEFQRVRPRLRSVIVQYVLSVERVQI